MLESMLGDFKHRIHAYCEKIALQIRKENNLGRLYGRVTNDNDTQRPK